MVLTDGVVWVDAVKVEDFEVLSSDFFNREPVSALIQIINKNAIQHWLV